MNPAVVFLVQEMEADPFGTGRRIHVDRNAHQPELDAAAPNWSHCLASPSLVVSRDAPALFVAMNIVLVAQSWRSLQSVARRAQSVDAREVRDRHDQVRRLDRLGNVQIKARSNYIGPVGGAGIGSQRD